MPSDSKKSGGFYLDSRQKSGEYHGIPRKKSGRDSTDSSRIQGFRDSRIPLKKSGGFYLDSRQKSGKFQLGFWQPIEHMYASVFHKKQQNKYDIPRIKKRYIVRKLSLYYVGFLLNFSLKSHLLFFF